MRAAGTTLTLGELRQETADLPDSTPLRCEYFELASVEQRGEELLLRVPDEETFGGCGMCP